MSIAEKRQANNSRISIVIPTAGLDISRLKSCLSSIKMAANDIAYHVSIILCPATTEIENNLKTFQEKNITIYSLPGPFNYCRSINFGIRKSEPKDKYVLFLNDDVVFTKKGDLKKLRDTLIQTHWACVGPYILFNPDVHDETWPIKKSNARVKRGRGYIRTNVPVSGCCALWSRDWLNKIGMLDEMFGIGWGMDEADLCLRAVRSGGRYGRQDDVAIKHIMHASFGSEYTKYTGKPHMLSLNYFRKKYGKEVDEWGKSYHWWPKPITFRSYYSDPSKILRLPPYITGESVLDANTQIKEICNKISKWFPNMRFTFSGSVVKNTFVWGIGDIDIICMGEKWKGVKPKRVIKELYEKLNADCKVKNLVNHLVFDGNGKYEIDIVPGWLSKKDRALMLPSIDGKMWVKSSPEFFVNSLSELDAERNGIIIPAIRTVKIILHKHAPDLKISGHHIEMLVYNVGQLNQNIRTTKELIRKVIEIAPEVTRKPIRDMSGQFVQIDTNLGPINSQLRKKAVRKLTKIREYYKV